MTKLNKIPVLFEQEQHIYTNTDTFERYQGITSTLLHRLFPNKYDGIPKAVLDNAASRGSIVHEDIELAESIGTTPSTQEGKNYLKLKEAHGLNFLESEYTVSDLEHYATNIDVIYDVEENVVDIADYKTTSKFDRESVSWQLSICAYFLELNNPHVKVRKLFGIWLRGDIAQLIEVERHNKTEVMALIDADVNDEVFDYSPAFPDYITENESSLYVLGKRIKELTEEYEAIKSEVLSKMVENKDKSFDTGRVLITYVAPSERESFDSKKFKSENAELYSKYTKVSQTKESLKLTFR
ncbi:MAG: hypothetical protein J5733_05845 [Bacteroidaceae bacterium]|nr:hypothetical protein [Bacteroidaceae bacterium]